MILYLGIVIWGISKMKSDDNDHTDYSNRGDFY